MSDRDLVLPVGDGTLGWAFASSRVGASHVRAGKSCQDAYAIRSGSVAGQACVIVAVADGHGDERHDRSHLGAGLAVQAAVDEMIALHLHFGGVESRSQAIGSFKHDFPRRLARRWRAAVAADAETRDTSGSAAPNEGVELPVRYGTTLLVAMVVDGTILVGQIGDGDAIFVGTDGEVESPPARDSDQVGVVTESLCSTESHRRWRTAVMDASDGGLLLLTTDGLVNAFSDDEQWLAFARSLKDRIREFGPSEVASALPQWLDHYSARGSGDDVTLAVVLIRPQPKSRSQPESRAEEHSPADEVKPVSSEPPPEEAPHVDYDRAEGHGRDVEGIPDGEAEVG